MYYYRDKSVTIRPLEEGDCAAFAGAFAAQGWDKPEEQYRRYLREQQAGQRQVLVALWQGELAGYLTLVSRAGGHLASTLATHYPQELKPAFQILFYPVISMDTTITHRGSRDNLIGQNPDPQLVDYYSNELQVDAETPRAFIALSDDDDVVPVENSLRYYNALHRHHVPVSLHIYPNGGHGWGYQETFRFKNEVHSALADWLRSF